MLKCQQLYLLIIKPCKLTSFCSKPLRFLRKVETSLSLQLVVASTFHLSYEILDTRLCLDGTLLSVLCFITADCFRCLHPFSVPFILFASLILFLGFFFVYFSYVFMSLTSYKAILSLLFSTDDFFFLLKHKPSEF